MTFLTSPDGLQLDLVQEFSKVGKDVILSRARSVWDDPNIAATRHTRGSAAYHARLFRVFLTNSMSSDFLTILYSRIDLKYSMDGTGNKREHKHDLNERADLLATSAHDRMPPTFQTTQTVAAPPGYRV
jgi:hypothetical protein